MTDKQFKQNVDSWIKELKVEVSKISEIFDLLQEHDDEIEYLYSLNYEMEDEIENLKQEINALKLIQIIHIKQMQKDKEVKDVIQKTQR